MFGDDKGMQGVVVKQLVPRGSAERVGKVVRDHVIDYHFQLVILVCIQIRVGDKLLRVGDVDVSNEVRIILFYFIDHSLNIIMKFTSAILYRL